MGVDHRRFLPSEGRVLYLQDTESKANARPRTETFVYHAKTPSLVPGDGNPWMGLMQRGVLLTRLESIIRWVSPRQCPLSILSRHSFFYAATHISISWDHTYEEILSVYVFVCVCGAGGAWVVSAGLVSQ